MNIQAQRIVRGAAVALAGAHLLLSGLFAGYQDGLIARLGGGDLLFAYGDLTGARSNFNFFAPSVASQIRARMILEDEGRHYEKPFSGKGKETDLRISTMFNNFVMPEAQPLLLRSWGAYALKTNPEAEAVTVIVEIYDIPRLAAGQKSLGSWREIARQRFAV